MCTSGTAFDKWNEVQRGADGWANTLVADSPSTQKMKKKLGAENIVLSVFIL